MTDERKKYLKGKRGIALVFVMIVMAIALALALAIGYMLFSEISSSRRTTSVAQAFFAAEGGQEYGRRLLDFKMETFSVPTATRAIEMNEYAARALSGNRTGDEDIGVLRDFVPGFDDFLPRNEVVISEELGEGDNAVVYEISYDFTPTDVDYPDPGDPSGAYVFYYDYAITATGTKPFSTLSGEQKTQLTGSFEVTIFHPSFAFYNFFTVRMDYNGSQIYFAYDEMLAGPVYVGSRPGFAGDYHGGGPTFTDQFQSTWSSYETSSRIYNPVVQWNEEYPPLWGVDEVPTPQNSFSQSRVSMGDLAGAGDMSPLTHEERRENLGLIPGGSSPPEGVYWAAGDGTTDEGNNTEDLLGGIYVYGDVDQMRLAADGNHQYISIRQGGEQTILDINSAAGTTTVYPPDDPAKTYEGVPNGVAYVDGELDNVGGDQDYAAHIQRDTQMTIACDSGMYVDDHILYEEDPREVEDAQNVLGLFSGRGNVLISDDAPYAMTVHAIFMGTSEDHGFGVENFRYKEPSGPLNILGGIIMDSYQAIGTFNSYGQQSGYYKNFTYDYRLLDRTFAPPFFPVVEPFVGRLRSINRTDWAQIVPELPEE